MLRILHIVPALTKGGAEQVLVDLANEAQRRGHAVAVLAGFDADPQLNRNRLNPAIGFESIASSGAGKLTAYARIIPWLWRNRHKLAGYDVIHCHLTYAAILGIGVLGLRKWRRAKRPVVIETFHGVGMPIKARQRWLASQLAKLRDGYAIMAEDAYWTGFLANHPGLPSAVIPNGLAPTVPAAAAEAAAWREHCGVPAKVLVVGTVGRIRAERNPLATLAAFAAIATVRPDVHFLIAGDGPMTAAVRQRAVELGFSDRLHLPGLVSNPMLALANIDLYISMNVGPITGIAGLEAAAAGLPVIALQARADYQASNSDWIWSSSDPAEVGRAALDLLDDQQQRRSLGARQQDHVNQHYSIAAAQDRYEELYRRALSST